MKDIFHCGGCSKLLKWQNVKGIMIAYQLSPNTYIPTFPHICPTPWLNDYRSNQRRQLRKAHMK